MNLVLSMKGVKPKPYENLKNIYIFFIYFLLDRVDFYIQRLELSEEFVPRGFHCSEVHLLVVLELVRPDGVLVLDNFYNLIVGVVKVDIHIFQ